MDTPGDHESSLERTERLHAEILGKQPERDRQHAATMANLNRIQEEIRLMLAQMDRRDALRRGEDGFDGY